MTVREKLKRHYRNENETNQKQLRNERKEELMNNNQRSIRHTEESVSSGTTNDTDTTEETESQHKTYFLKGIGAALIIGVALLGLLTVQFLVNTAIPAITTYAIENEKVLKFVGLRAAAVVSGVYFIGFAASDMRYQISKWRGTLDDETEDPFKHYERLETYYKRLEVGVLAILMLGVLTAGVGVVLAIGSLIVTGIIPWIINGITKQVIPYLMTNTPVVGQVIMFGIIGVIGIYILGRVVDEAIPAINNWRNSK